MIELHKIISYQKIFIKMEYVISKTTSVAQRVP